MVSWSGGHSFVKFLLSQGVRVHGYIACRINGKGYSRQFCIGKAKTILVSHYTEASKVQRMYVHVHVADVTLL